MLQDEETYRNGVLDGEVREYGTNSRLSTRAIYKKGKLLRMWTYDEAGNLKKEEKF